MAGPDYSKHKDKDPLETVATIRETLSSLGLESDLTWTSSQFDGTWSNRVSIPGTSLGTNGKGTSRDYAAASGYAELMERIENKIVGRRTHVHRTFSTWGFYDHPDERLVRVDKVVDRHDPILEAWLEGWGCTTDEQRRTLVEEFARAHYARDDDLIAEVPFVDVGSSAIRWLPPALYGKLLGSNGMCAGNTLEECLVQGLSEVFERYVLGKVLSGEVVLPQVPREALEAWDACSLIDRIEGGGRYRVHVLDGSLGKGYPVVVTVLVDRARGTFGVECGAHPSLAVAVERTLTEAFQGKTVEQFTCVNRLAPKEASQTDSNKRGVYKNCAGLYPPSLLLGEPSWEWGAWEAVGDATNAELLRRMTRLLKGDGFTLLVRDASHLGFPACHVVVPGMSEIMQATGQSLELIRLRRDVSDYLARLGTLDEGEQERLLGTEGTDDVEDLFRFGRPYRGGTMHPLRVFGYLHLARGEYEASSASFRAFSEFIPSPGRLFWQAMADYAQWRGFGQDRAGALELARTLYPPAVSRCLETSTDEETNLLNTQFPRMSCYDCDACELGRRNRCLGAADGRAFAAIDAALARSRVSQEALLDRLRQLGIA